MDIFKNKGFLSGLLVLAAVLHGLGVSLPMLVIEGPKILEFSIFRDRTPSILDIAADLYNDPEYILFILVVLFSIIFPVAKILVVHGIILDTIPKQGGLGKALHFLGKWSMAEIFLAAIIVYAVKTAGVSNVAAQAGLWCYALAILLTAAAGIAAKKL